MEPRETIGQRIKAAMQARGNMTQTALAERLGIKPSSVSTMISGKSRPSAQTIKGLCDVLRIRREWLVDGEGEMFAPEPLDDVAAACRKHGVSEYGEALIRLTLTFSPETQREICEKMRRITAEMDTEQASTAMPDTDSLSTDSRAVLAEFARQLLLEEKAGEKSSASGRGSTGTEGSRA